MRKRKTTPIDTRTRDPVPWILALEEGWQCRCGAFQIMIEDNGGNVILPWTWMSKHKECGR
jgi:hypothetical protein